MVRTTRTVLLEDTRKHQLRQVDSRQLAICLALWPQGLSIAQQQQDLNAAYGAYDPYSTIGYSQVPDMATERAVVDPTAAAVTGAVGNQQQQDANAGYGTYDPYSTGGYSQAPAGNGDYAVMDTGAATVGSTGDYQQVADMGQYETYDAYGSGEYSQAPLANGTDSLQQEQAGKVQQFDGSTGYTPFDPYSSGGYGQEDGGSGQQFGAYDPYSTTGYSQAPVENGAAAVAVVDTANGGESQQQQQQQYPGYGGYDPYTSGGYSQAPVVNGVGDSSLVAADKQMQVDSASGYAAFDPYNAGGVSSPHGSAQMVTPQSFGYTGVPTAPAGVFDLQSQSERSSLDMAYERDLSAGDLAPAQVQDPLGRLQGRRPIMAFGFGGRLFTMFPRHVQRFNAQGGSAKTAPGMLRVQQLAEHMPPELSAQHEAAVFNTPLLGGETTKAALLKRRDVAVGCARAWLERMQGSNEERALVGVLAGVLEALGDNAQPEMARAGEALQPLFSVQEPTKPNGQEPPEPIAHGSLADMQEIEGLLLAGRRSEAVALACQRGMWAHALVVASCTGKGRVAGGGGSIHGVGDARRPGAAGAAVPAVCRHGGYSHRAAAAI
ncbi:hypothetical protein DL89DRAFT_52689 [Linderina pennispora]|uniref:Protein transport protein sec16 n=1 Tax=Linderina pennispora TaxID=61395 RepID=A0A1Y1W0S9_9FUNG|nr:uncharacterized protein DL89DRAFT_52689 [Linderina pennispora]ORX67133.1 hypothetical protein DL89DRAFT_52689 [Linderina pennispora]